MKYKILTFAVVLTILISLFVIPSFAISEGGYVAFNDSFMFDTVISDDVIPGTLEIDFESNGDNFYKINVFYRGYIGIEYIRSDGSLIQVYSDSHGWADEAYRSIVFQEGCYLEPEWEAFFSLNEGFVFDSFYSQIYNLLVTSVYGDLELTSDMSLSVSFLSTLLSLVIILLPVLLAFCIFVWILKRV